MKYAVGTILDQTFGYYTGNERGSYTTVHSEAKLFEDLKEAVRIVSRHSAETALCLRQSEYFVDCSDEDIIKRIAYFIETVEDEIEFRSREDTW